MFKTKDMITSVALGCDSAINATLNSNVFLNINPVITSVSIIAFSAQVPLVPNSVATTRSAKSSAIPDSTIFQVVLESRLSCMRFVKIKFASSLRNLRLRALPPARKTSRLNAALKLLMLGQEFRF